MLLLGNDERARRHSAPTGRHSAPIAGVDYPTGLDEVTAWFPDDRACLAYLERLRWPDGFVCPGCGIVGEAWRQSRGRRTCRSCRRQTTVTAGTIFARTRTPLRSWFAAAWYLTSQKSGTNALGLQRLLGLGNYQTAWTMLHKLRRAMAPAEDAPLVGQVEVDEARLIATATPQRSRRSPSSEPLVAIAVEVREPRALGRVRMRCIRDASRRSLVPFVRDVVGDGARVHTDGCGAYATLARHGFEHVALERTEAPDGVRVIMPNVNRVAAHLRRWLAGTHQGAVRPSHLPAYLAEFTFRFNGRAAAEPGLLFYHLLRQAVDLERPS